MSKLAEAILSWSPAAGWSSVLGPAREALDADRSDGTAWAQIAMTLGDTRQPELCLLVAIHGLDVAPADSPSRGRLGAHAKLAAMDLGVEIDDLGDWVRDILADDETVESVAEAVLTRAAVCG